METAILTAEERLGDARARAEDPAVATDAGALEALLADLERSRAEVARLYARWAELEAKMVAAAEPEGGRPPDEAS